MNNVDGRHSRSAGVTAVGILVAVPRDLLNIFRRRPSCSGHVGPLGNTVVADPRSRGGAPAIAEGSGRRPPSRPSGDSVDGEAVAWAGNG